MSYDRQGMVVILNGPSSAGKTTIARQTRTLLGPGCAALSLDDLYLWLHPGQKNSWATFALLNQTLFAAAAALARGGMSTVLVDTIFERPACIDLYRAAMEGLDVRLVGLSCPVEILEERERVRGNRPPGLARRQHAHIHEGCDYALMLDTSRCSPDEAARAIASLIAGVEMVSDSTSAET